MNKFKKYLLGALAIGILSLIYNFCVFSLFDFYPDIHFAITNFTLFDFYLVIFLKGFLIGLVLMFLFSIAYTNISDDMGKGWNMLKGIFFFVLYAVFALLAFTLGEAFMMETQEGMLVLLTLDGFIEAIIATFPIRFFEKRI